MTVAERTRDAVRAHPFLYRALQAGVVNYTAAARFLDVGEDTAVAAALRRYAAELPESDRDDRRVRWDMRSGLDSIQEPRDGPDEPLFSVDGTSVGPADGNLTGLLARGDVGPDALREALERLSVEGVSVEASGATASGGRLVVAVDRRDGPTALRLLEDAV